MARTYLDSGVLIAICRGKPEVAQSALALLNDPDREIILSEAVRLEVMPKAIYEDRRGEREALESVLSSAQVLPWSLRVLEQAYQLACIYGIAAMDAIHLAFAVEAKAEEFVTPEKPTKPLFWLQQKPA
jgi:predicted nucleic acid-binding protein